MNLRYCIRCEETYFCDERPCPICNRKLYYFGRERVSLSPINILIEYDKKHPYNPLHDFKGIYINEIITPEVDASILECEDVLKHKPDEPNALFYLGMTYFSRKEFLKAKHYLEQLVALKPNNEQPYQRLADIYTDEGETDKAIAQLLFLKQHVSEDWALHDKLGRAYLQKGDSKKALSAFVQAYRQCKDEERKKSLKEVLRKISTTIEEHYDEKRA